MQHRWLEEQWRLRAIHDNRDFPSLRKAISTAKFRPVRGFGLIRSIRRNVKVHNIATPPNFWNRSLLQAKSQIHKYTGLLISSPGVTINGGLSVIRNQMEADQNQIVPAQPISFGDDSVGMPSEKD
jgi:hypothetical protein